MSSPSGAADATLSDPGARGDERSRIAALTSAGDGDRGQPVAEVPPLVEPKTDLFARRPPRTSFLAPAAGKGSFAPRQRVAPTTAIPPLIEPMPMPRETVRSSATPPMIEPMPMPRETARSSSGARKGLRRGLAKQGGSPWLAKHWKLIGAGAICGAVAAVVAVMYVFGMGPFVHARQYPTAAAPADPAQRVAYFQRGAAAGDAGSELQLAILYAKGEGVAQDFAMSANWFRAAAKQGVPRAQYDLGVMYERGRGVKADLAEAANWYLKSAQGGYPLAQYNLAGCYTKGQGIRQDLTEAALWYRRAATQGVVMAMSNLAVMYDKGDGVSASPVDAYAWYRAAGRRGDQNSARRADYLYSSMAKLDQIRAEALTSDVANSIHDFPADGGDAVPAAPATAQH